MLSLRTETSKEWLDKVFSDFDSFLIEHAACERKASSTSLSFIVRYPDRKEILEPLIRMSREELEHFHQVYMIIEKRGLSLRPDSKDEYVSFLLEKVRHGRNERFLDRLILSGIVEARGCERLGLISKYIEEPELKEFYLELTRCEARHHSQYIKLANIYFDEKTVKDRVEDFLDYEAESISRSPLTVSLF